MLNACISLFQSKVLKKRNIINITKRHYLQTADLDTAFRNESESSDTENREPVSLPFTSYSEEHQDLKDLEKDVLIELKQEVTFNEIEKGVDPFQDLESLTPNGTPIKTLPFSPSVVSFVSYSVSPLNKPSRSFSIFNIF